MLCAVLQIAAEVERKAAAEAARLEEAARAAEAEAARYESKQKQLQVKLVKAAEEREQLQQQKQKLAVSEWGCCKWLVVGIGWCLFFWSGQPTTAESSNREPPLKKGLQKEGCNPTGICLRRRRYSAATTWF